ncbi:MAG: hypothetical protein WBP22_05635 [Candidatus Saccharimonas sp.]
MQVINTVNDANGVLDEDEGVWREYIVDSYVSDSGYVGGNSAKDASDIDFDTTEQDIARFNELIAIEGVLRVELSTTIVFISKRLKSSWEVLDPKIRQVIAAW